MITILVVEDDTKLNFIVSKKLGEEGFEVKACGKSNSGLLISWRRPKLI